MNRLRRIFALAPDCHAPHKYYHLLWRRHIYDALLPHVSSLVTPEEIDFAWARPAVGLDQTSTAGARQRASAALWARIQAAHREEPLDAVISYCFASDLELDVVRETRRLGVPWINFFCDSTHLFDRVEPLARVVSLNWFPETAARSQYQALGVPALCAPYALNPDWLPDLTNRQPVRSAVFIGLPTSNRITQLGCLRLRGCPVEIRGHGWMGSGEDPFYSATPARQRLLKAVLRPDIGEKILRRLVWPMVRAMVRGPLPDVEFAEYVKDSLVILGLNQGRDPKGRLTSYLKFRDVEFPGYGCCYLTEMHPDLAQVFEVGREILTFHSLSEAAAQIRRLRQNPELAREIGRAGRRRVLTDHTWAVRLRQFEKHL